MLQQRGPCCCFLVVAPLPGDDFAVGDGDQKAPAAAQVDSVDLDLVEDFSGVVQIGVGVPAPLGLVVEGSSGAAGVFGLGELAHQPGDEACQLVPCGEVRAVVCGGGVAVGASPALLAVALPVLLLRALADTT